MKKLTIASGLLIFITACGLGGCVGPATVEGYIDSCMAGVVNCTGEVGLYTSIAVDSGDVPHISFYAQGDGDLKYAMRSGDVWLIWTLDSGNDVGQYSSIAVDGNDQLHISYYDAISGDLKYASGRGDTWSTETVDSTGDVGLYTSITVDTLTNNPFISYYDQDNEQIKLAFKDPGWNIVPGPFVNLGSDSTAIALEPMFINPIIAYYDFGVSELRLAMYDRADAYESPVVDASDWGVETVLPSNDLIQHIDLVYHPAAEPRLSYFVSASPGKVQYAEKICSGAGCATQVDGAQPTGQGTWNFDPSLDDVGVFNVYTSIALDSNGAPRISYNDSNPGFLKYADKTSGTWVVQSIDDVPTVGEYLSLALDSTDAAHISYFDATNSDLKYYGQ